MFLSFLELSWRIDSLSHTFYIPSLLRHLPVSNDIEQCVHQVMSTGNSSNDWKDAKYTLAFDTIFKQDAKFGEEIGNGTVNSVE